MTRKDLEMLVRFDPFRDFDRAAGPRPAPSVPMEAVRRGGHVVMHLDLPGVSSDDIDITVERNILTVSAERRRDESEGDETIANERRFGPVERRFHMAETLDLQRLEAHLADGVLTLQVPVAETARPRRIEVRTGDGDEPPAALSA